MDFGDILLLEAQDYDPVSGTYLWPVEVVDATFDAIRLATALGITVVEAGCNGTYNLDTYANLSGKHIFDRSSSDFRESGAIMVGAGSSTAPHTRLSFSNYGSRIDVYAWGEDVDTTTTDSAGTNNALYTTTFNGTSSASPIVTGAAMVVQGIANASVGFKLSPFQVRAILTMGGTPSSTPATDRIGMMPNLKAIIDGPCINLTPDLYIRDYVGDVSNTTSGLVSASPDIIVRQTSVADPQMTFGTGSGTENNNALSQDVLQGQANYIYIRILNKGPSLATSVTCTVYWSPPATLVTPNLWNPIGTVSLPSVPSGNILTVSPELRWPAEAIPAPGHYCFVAICGASGGPAPLLPNNFPDYVKFVEENRQVAWRNFNVIPSPPSSGSPGGFHHFPVHIPGAFDAPRRFVLRSEGSLPLGSEVQFQAPLTLARALGIMLREGQIHDKQALMPLHPFGRVDIGAGILPVKNLATCELRVRVPVNTYKSLGTFEFSLVQEWGGVEVGRLNYHFGPEASLSKGGGCGCHPCGY
ncbi:hypothetical protein H9Q72_008065 [Fusarium xylarioides]|uniref:Peptidase S8/S53 domain-containing protein n=1 Tax=Fusarium xylarioides TaxID=221167 RepID=A0A9P7L027_9HYPO|nr:hypothetical protein H9Q72_008065 [Fusarium xylarioides]